MNKIEMLDAGIYLVFYYSSATKFSNYSVRCQVCVVPLIILALRTCMKHRLWTFQWWKFSFCFWSSVCHDRIVWLPAIECEMNEWFMSSNPLSTHGKWNFLVFAIHAKPIEENDLGYKKKNFTNISDFVYRFFHTNQTYITEIVIAEHRFIYDIRRINHTSWLLGKHRLDHYQQANLYNQTRGELSFIVHDNIVFILWSWSIAVGHANNISNYICWISTSTFSSLTRSIMVNVVMVIIMYRT